MDLSGLSLLLSVLLGLNIVFSKNQEKKIKMLLKFIILHILLIFLALSSSDKDAKEFKLIEESIH